MSREVDEGRKLSDVRQRRDARVKWEAWQRLVRDCSNRNVFSGTDGIHAPTSAAYLRLIRSPSKCVFPHGAFAAVMRSLKHQLSQTLFGFSVHYSPPLLLHLATSEWYDDG